ncbi:MAG: efflux RND transporter permease subunit [Gammaproteobacteria bacterium]|nr:MAG: efflux RND transporter permease subunit [Gammaproteobacteria bacterium]UTW42269.1 efflux RND transporter permease subunit [bacterium SCSIO 12844]
MKLSEICIERPVFAAVLSLLIIVLGLVGFSYLETRYFPKIEENTASVSISYSGASPSLMQTSITIPVENAIYSVDGLKSMTSTSAYGSTTINLTFYPNTNMTKAVGDVRDAIASITAQQLPPDADTPTISTDGVERPVLNIGFIDNQLTPAQINDYVSQYIVPQFLEIPGMGAAWTYGASSYAMRIWLNPEKMAALGITVSDVQNVLNSNNISFSGGSIQGKSRNFSIVSDTDLKTPEQFKRMIIKTTNNQIVRLGDIADVQLGSRSLIDSPMRINGKNAIDLELRPTDQANPINVADLSKNVMKKVQSKLPKDMTMFITYDQSTFLLHSIDDSYKTLIEAILLVMLVVFVFLGSIRASFIPIVTIPICVIGAFGIMLLFGFSINVITLLAIILAIGLVVDDAIVMLENIHRHIEMGKPPKIAAIEGSKEIGFSIIAMTLTLAAVYAPIGFSSGFTAAVFREFAFTLAGAVVISGFVALTASPMMCSLILRSKQKESKIERLLERIFERVNQSYQRLLSQALKIRYWIVGILVGLAFIGYALYNITPQSFIPKEDIGYFTASITSPPGATVPYTNYYMEQLEKHVYQKNKDILSNAAFIFSGSADNFVTMKPWGIRDQSTFDVIKELTPLVDSIPGIKTNFSIPDPVSFGSDTDSSDIIVYIMSLGNYNSLLKSSDKITHAFKQLPALINVDNSLKFNNYVYQISFKRNQAAMVGVNPQDIADTFSLLMSGKHITNVLTPTTTYPVIVQMNLKDLRTFGSLNKIYVPSKTNQMIPLANLVNFDTSIRQSSLLRYNRMNAAKISANLAPGYSLSEAQSEIAKVLAQDLKPNERSTYGGRLQAYLDSAGTMVGLFALAIVFIYLVLAAQFESFVDPFIILLTVPLSIVGALITILLIGGSLNLYTNIGLITLVGLISKHGILITQFSNECLNKGLSLKEAVIKGAVIRLRPILMTTFAMVLGSIPLALASGPGSISNSQIGAIIVGGLLFGTLFSLFIVPVAYLLLSPLDHKKRRLMRLK